MEPGLSHEGAQSRVGAEPSWAIDARQVYVSGSK
jgi:hypothetical protein